MPNNQTDPIIPAQEKGAHSDTIAEKVLTDETTAKQFYQQLCIRLQDVNNWKSLTGVFTADFFLCDQFGEEKQPPLLVGDHFRIDGPGPGSLTGKGYDWVQVINVEQREELNEQEFFIRVHPVPNPKGDKDDTAHFFTDESTSTFIARRVGKKVTAEVHGRNETPNIGADNLFDKARNAVAGAVAAVFYSKFQWRALVEGLVNFELN